MPQKCYKMKAVVAGWYHTKQTSEQKNLTRIEKIFIVVIFYMQEKE